MIEVPMLSILLFLPLLGALALILVPEYEEKSMKKVALWTTTATLIWSGVVAFQFDYTAANFQFVEKHFLLQSFGLTYYLGVDGLSLFLVLLTTILMPICLLVSWESIEKHLKLYLSLFLILETFILGSFLSLNMILFYVFFEGVLVPMYFLIGIWGGSDRVYAAFKFFLYTMLGSVLMLVSILLILTHLGTLDIADTANQTFVSLTAETQFIIFLCFFASFAVKVPMWPLHTWLPDAHVQAPTAASVILAGVLLKMGGYGFIRFLFYYAPNAAYEYREIIYLLSVIAVIYTSLVALVQTDMKKLIAYSSVAHMGVVTLGAFSMSKIGISGAVFHMISHGIISGALFICVGFLYERTKTREIAAYGGLATVMPLFSIGFLIYTFASIGIPGTSGFIGELFVIIAAYKQSGLWAAGIATGLFLGAAYSLRLYRAIIFGPIKQQSLLALKDLSWREKGIFLPFLVLIFLLGVVPHFVLDPLNISAEKIELSGQKARLQNTGGN